MRKLCMAILLGCFSISLFAQPTFPVNGVADQRETMYAFKNATIVQDAQHVLNNATLLIRQDKIVAVGTTITIPSDAIVIDCSGKFIYPSFIDLYSDYGVAAPQGQGFGGRNSYLNVQLNSNAKGAFGWNQAIKADVDAGSLFVVDDAKAKTLREAGFGAVLTHQRDGIARGTGTFVSLATIKENHAIIKEKASAHYSFNKGTSQQSYPSSMMGSIALLRQTYYDAKWYKNNAAKEGVNLSLNAWNSIQSLPQIFEANDKWNALRADKIGDEFGIQYIIKTNGNEYQRVSEIASTGAALIVPVNYPMAMDVEDPNDARFVSLSDMKHWELAPTNPASLEKAGLTFSLTTADLRSPNAFMGNLRKAIEHGLSESKALEALTAAPAKIIGVADVVGSLEQGKLANFIITTGNVFSEKSSIIENWIQGNRYGVKTDKWIDVAGSYALTVNGEKGFRNFTLQVKSSAAANVISNDTIATKFSFDGKIVKISFPAEKKSNNNIKLSGMSNGNVWNGYGEDGEGNKFTWTATLNNLTAVTTDSAKKKPSPKLGAVTYPFTPYGWSQAPKQENILFKNATVWTNEADGKMENADVLIKDGKIAAVGKGLQDASAKVVDASGKHITAGIIDEHSHIAAASINEGGQSVTSEVRIADNLNPDDINIYRQLSGGVTSSHILHGSANTIGGQTQMIKLRWGANDEKLKFEGSDPFIKFALGENVKRSSMPMGNVRFPDTRMGVEQVLTDAFTRAKDYQKAIWAASVGSKPNPKSKTPMVGADPMLVVRRDLELDALVEILNSKRFITCHSYVQSEINAAMKVGESLGFKFNTFTHILEGYKVADKMKAHGAAASTFSDWWNYKMEVVDAIPYNATIMSKVGLNVAINSDDAEMARRLNQEAAKSVKFGGMSEEDALKMVTLNPAKMLHVDNRVGSIKVGKDADLVVWSDHPLSIYAKSEKTIVDGIVYFDREKDAQMRKELTAERNRLIQKMMGEKRAGSPMAPATPSYVTLLNCGDHDHSHGFLTIEKD
ncbi:MAG: amidohydrolase family protein [Bacteroidota bacterium]|jgi:imidazolonepropionase-like amidohydrolase